MKEQIEEAAKQISEAQNLLVKLPKVPMDKYYPIQTRLIDVMAILKALSQQSQQPDSKDLESQLAEAKKEIEEYKNSLPHKALVERNRVLQSQLQESEERNKQLIEALHEIDRKTHTGTVNKIAKETLKVVGFKKSDLTICKCLNPDVIITVHPLPDICNYCRKEASKIQKY